MSLKQGTSIFNRQFKRAFNAGKYQNLTAARIYILFSFQKRDKILRLAFKDKNERIYDNICNFYLWKYKFMGKKMNSLHGNNNMNKHYFILSAGETYSHLGWLSNLDLKLGRGIFTFGIVGVALCIYLEPSYFHETFGHMSQPPKYDIIDLKLSGEEKKLNKQILKRQEAESKLDSFVSLYSGSDVAK